ncbi:leucine-rich repeat protein [Prolixibacteraceae bacterium]|nr:leucine-rich repeat protein [Prolixibacteraceae bacterium]
MTYLFSSALDYNLFEQSIVDDPPLAISINNDVELICKDLESGVVICGVNISDKEQIILSLPDKINGKEVVGIAKGAFANQKNIINVDHWPSKLRFIAKRAFVNCYNLRSYVSFPDYLEILGYEAFGGCKSLTTIELPFYLRKVERNCFKGCLCLKMIIYNSYHSVEVISRGKRVNRSFELPLEVETNTQLIVPYDIFSLMSNLSNYLVFSRIRAMNGR